MKRLSRMFGVTLLEIMLVLAIAAMVIVMSIRYYTSATMSQQANTVRSQIQAIAAAMDNLAVGAGTYSQVSASAIINAMGGAQNLKTPWNTTISVNTPAGVTSYVVVVPGTTTSLCSILAAQVKSNPRFTGSCTASGFQYTYDSTK